ncbi:MAG: cohesin domain-containing protein [Defluviitaleaceae bacterium]|nr:cohesin domain-containing protein [Defluviitaleaceae bacterium]MCL2275468.1 cohesin domain-containing protein [Defluviitaleaceae bacterium]
MIKKRIVIFLTIVSLLMPLLIFHSTAAGLLTFSIESGAEVSRGESITIPIRVANNPGFTAVGLVVSYDPAVLQLQDVIAPVAEMPLNDQFLMSTVQGTQWISLVNDDTENWYVNGTVIELNFFVRNDAPLSTSAINLGFTNIPNGIPSNATGDLLTASTTVSGSITVGSGTTQPADGPVFTINSGIEGIRNQAVTVPIIVSNNPGFAAAGIILTYDPAILLLTNVVAPIADMPLNAQFAPSAVPGTQWIPLLNDVPVNWYNNETVIYLTFQVYSNAMLGASAVNIGFTTTPNGIPADADGNLLTASTTVSGSVLVREGQQHLPSEYSITIINNPPGVIIGQTGAGMHVSGNTVNLFSGNREGYTFTGWSSMININNASNANASFVMPSNNVTVTAQWTPITQNNLTFSIDTGITAMRNRNVTIPIRVSNNPGFAVAGLMLTYDSAVLSLLNVSAPVTEMPLNPQFTLSTEPGTQWIPLLNEIPVNWHGNGPVVNLTFNVNAGAALGTSAININFTSVPNGTPSNAAGNLITASTAVSGSVIVEDELPILPDEFLVTINNNPSGIVSGQSGAGLHAPGTVVNLNAGNRAGYVFSGWSSAVTINNPSNVNASFIMPSGNVVVTANWTAVVQPQRLTFTVDSGIPATRNQIVTVPIRVSNNPGFVTTGLEITYNPAALQLTNVNAPVPAMPLNAQFSMSTTPGIQWIPLLNTSLTNWHGNEVVVNLTFMVRATAPLGSSSITLSFTSAPDGMPGNAAGQILSSATTVSGSVIISGEAIQPTQHSVTMINNPTGMVSGQMGAGVHTVGAWVNISAGNRPGYTFTGWSSNAPINNNFNANAGFIMPAHNVTITVNWTPIPVTTDFTFAVGTGLSAVRGSTITVPINVSNNPGFVAVGMVVTYNPAVLQLTNVTAPITAMPLNAQFSLSATAGTQWIPLINTGLVNWHGNGTVANLTFTVRANAPLGNSTVGLSFTASPNGTPSNAAGQIIHTAKTASAGISITATATTQPAPTTTPQATQDPNVGQDVAPQNEPQDNVRPSVLPDINLPTPMPTPRPTPIPTPAPTIILTEPIAQPAPIVLTTLLNGRTINFANQPPIIMPCGTTLIPVRETFERLGFSVTWDSTTRTATLTRERTIITITDGSRLFTVHGITRQHDNLPAQMINGHLMVPFVQLMNNVGVRAWRDEYNVLHLFQA